MTDLHVRVDPGNKVAGLCVDSGEARLGTPVSPGDDTVKTESTHEGSTRVSLARVLAAGIESSTDHGVGDVILAIGISAVIISDNGDIDLHQGASVPPSDVVPHPETVQMCPSGYSCPSLGMLMEPMLLALKSASSSRSNMQMSFSMVQES